MACIHYKFKNSLDFDSITFDGLHISVRDLKESIMQRKKLNDTDMDLLIINALNAKAYKDEDEMIPKNASVIVARIPLADAPKSRGPKTLNAYKEDPKPQPQVQMPDPTINRDNLAEVADLVTAKGSEEDKIKAMMKQSTKDFDPSNYQKKYPTGTPSPSYVCFKCNKTGHFIHNCPNAAAVSTEASGSPKSTEADIRRIKRPTGIPHTFLTTTVRTEQGAMALGDGRFAVPTIDQEAFKKGKKERPPFLPVPVEEKKKEITVPSVLKCLLCKDLLVDAVVIPCCGNSYCDECIRNYLLEDEDHKCPTCHEENVSPDKLIINQSVRQSVKDFKNEGLYEKPVKQLSPPPPPPPPPPPRTTSAIVIGSPLKLDTSIKTIDLTIEPSTPVQDEMKTPEDVPKGIAVLGGRLPVTIDAEKVISTSSAVSTTSSTSTSYRPIESKSVASVEGYVPPAPIPSLGTTGYRQHGPPVSLPNTALPPPGYRPQLLYPPSLVPPPPGFSVPPVFIPPQINKPLSEHEFYRAKHRLLGKPNPLDDYTRPLIDKESKRRSRSKSPRLQRTRSKSPRKRRSISRSRSRSRTPKDGPRKKSFSRSPPPKKRSYTKSRSRSPFRKNKSYSRSRSRSLRSRGRSRLRSRSLTPRSRSRSWTPKKFRGRSRSYTRSRTRSRSRTPRLRRRTYSRSPPPRRRSFSRSLTPRRRSFSRSPPPRRRSKSPYFRGRARSPAYSGYGRDWSPPPFRGYRSPPPRGFSPTRYGSGPPPFSFGGRNDDFTGRFDPRMYEGIFQDYLARFGLPPPPPPPSGQLERGMYYDPRKGVYRGGTRSRSKSPRSKRRDRSKDRKDDKSFRHKDKKPTDKYKYKNKKDDEKSRIKKDDEKAKFKKDDEKSKIRKDDEKAKTKKDDEKSKHRKEDDRSRGKEEKTKEKENKSKKPDEKGGPVGRSEKLKETEQKPVEKKLVKKVTKVKSKEDETMAKKESIALRLKTKAGVGKSPMKMGKPKIVKKDSESTNAALQAINRTGALKTIATTDNINTLPPKENIHANRKNSNLIEINTQEVLPEICDLQKSNMAEKDEEPMETDDNQNVAPEINEEVNKKDVLEESKNVTKEETKNVTKEVQPVDKRSEVPQKVKVTKKVKKFKKLVDIDASQSDSASDLEKAKVKRKKRALESNENDEKTQDESSAKRMNQELADEKELLQNGSSSIGSHEGQLMLSPPELSKWERDDYNEDKSPDLREKLKKKTEKKTLPRSVIESAEKAITQKQPKPTSVVASAVVPARPQKKLSVHDRLQKSPIRQTEDNLKKSPVRNDINKQSAVRQRRVYMDDDKQKNKEREEDENRKVHNRESSMQITISSDKNKHEKDDDLDRKLKIDRVQRRVSESEKSDRHKVLVNDKHHRYLEGEKSEKISKRKFSERDDSPEKESRQKNSSKEKVKNNSNEHESKDKKKEGKNSEKSKIKEKGDAVIEDDKNVDAKKTVNGPEKENSKSENETEEPPVKKKRYERKESIVDESTFVPDYNEHSDSEGGSDEDESSTSHANEEEEKKHKKHKKEKKHKKNKKHKHKHKKKKHKKHKEEKESVDKGE